MNKTLPTILIILLIALGAGYVIMKRNSVPTTTAPQSVSGPDKSSEVPVLGTGDMEVPANSSEPSGAESTNPFASKKTFTVEGSSFKFSPDKIEVKKGDTVEITFKNTEGFHDFVLDAFNVKTKQIGAGQSDTVTFTADKTGSFEYYCSVGQHRALGMVGTLAVTE